MFNKILAYTLIAISFILSGCKENKDNAFKVGTVAGPDTELLEAAKIEAKRCFNLDVKIVEFADYNLPNLALNDGDLDANVFQHQPFLDEQVASQDFKIETIAKTFIFPVGIYSKKIKNLEELNPKSKVAIPNDSTNEARALLLLQKANLITLKENVTINATIHDIATNPLNLQFIELDAANMPRALDDVTIAVINSNYATAANLSLTKDAIFVEEKDSPYANIIVTKTKDKNSIESSNFVKAMQSQAVIDVANRLFPDNAAVPTFNTSNIKSCE